MPHAPSQPTRVQRLSASGRQLIRTFQLVWSAARRWTVVWLGLLVLQGLLPVAIVYATRFLVDSVAAAIGNGLSWENARPVLLYAGLMGGVLLLSEVVQVVTEWIRTAQSELIQDRISALVQDKSVSLDLAFYETPEFYDHLYRARSDASTRPLALLESSGSLLQNTITLAAMAAVLVPYGLWLPPALLLSTLPAFLVVLRWNRRYHDWWTKSTEDRRRAQYYDLMLTDNLFAPEMRLFALADHVQAAFRSLRLRLRTERLTLLRKQYQSRLGAELLALAVSAGAIIWMVRQALLGSVTLGDIALFYQAFQRGQGVIRSLLGNLGQIYANSLFLGNLYEFLQLQPTVVEPENALPVPRTLRTGLSFRDVTFRYPGSERTALRDFNLAIPAGSIVAIVGANGAGKSTLLKLLCRFYDPDEGRVELDGIDLRRLSLAELRSRITFMFQVPIHYQATVRENIAMGSIGERADIESIREAARAAGIHDTIARLPRQYEQLLGRWFPTGTELSGGEWQRIAMARAFHRKAEILLLDEPTSMMDSWTEAAWFDRLHRLASGRTTVLITHRLTIAARADLIGVMMDGRIIESGSHDDLLARSGEYARSWNAQMRADSGAAAPVNPN